MKKVLFILMTAFAVMSCNDDCDHGTTIVDGGEFTYEYLSAGTGSWYDEKLNEEFRPSVNGMYYDKYCNLERAGETEGTYEISEKGTRLTQTYKFMGQNQFNDWKVSNVKELSFVISSDQNGAHTYEKVVETYTLAVDQTQQINFATEYPTYNIKSFSSNNEYIASVNSDGVITAMGEKGTTYIKITHDQGNAWVKVIVGDDYADLWYDYSTLLNYTYAQMRTLLGEPDQVSADCYSYMTPSHDVIKYFNIFINERTQTVEEVDLYLNKDVPSTQIISYMDARYYALSESDDMKLYSTASTTKESRAMLGYDKGINAISIVPREALDLWKDFTPLFGQTMNDIKKEMTNNGYPYSFTDNSYALDGSDYYLIPNNSYTDMVGFVFNKDKKMCEYWVYLNLQSVNTAYGFLHDKYYFSESETNPAIGSYIFYNSDQSTRIEFNLEGYVKYECLGMEGPTKPSGLWPDYSTALGKTHDEIVSEYGTPFMDDYSGIWYSLSNEYVSVVLFRADITDRMKYIYLMLKDAVDTSVITDYLGSLYTVYDSGTLPDGSQYVWTNGASMEESTFYIIYWPEDNQILYQGFDPKTTHQTQFNISRPSQLGISQKPVISYPFVKHKEKMELNPSYSNWYNSVLQKFLQNNKIRIN